jgi:hypothetical protein
MIIYQRKVAAKLASLRILAAFMLAGILYSSGLHIQNLFYFLLVAAIFLCLITVQDFVVTEEGMIVKKTYIYGLVPFTWHFRKTDQIELNTPAMYGGNVDINYDLDFIDIDGPADEIALGVGCLLPFIYQPKISHIKIQIKKLTALGRILSSVSIVLDSIEYRYAKTLADSNAND